MIISHKLKFIYIKNLKVSGSSLEIALSRYCGADDVIAPLNPEEEDLRISLGGRGAQNFEYVNQKERKYTYQSHSNAVKIKNSIPSKMWNDYLKITTIRCPYDSFISWYYHCRHVNSKMWNDLLKRGKQLNYKSYKYLWFQLLLQIVKMSSIDIRYSGTFEFFAKEFAESRQSDIQKYPCFHTEAHVDEKIAADFLIRYEHLDEDIKNLETKINCPGLLDTFQSIKAKGNLRPRRTAPYEMYSIYPKAKSIVDEILYEQQSQYEFLRKYWPTYKSKLEEAITRHQKSTGFKLKCLVKKVLFKIQSVILGIFINKYTKRLFP